MAGARSWRARIPAMLMGDVDSGTYYWFPPQWLTSSTIVPIFAGTGGVGRRRHQRHRRRRRPRGLRKWGGGHRHRRDARRDRRRRAQRSRSPARRGDPRRHRRCRGAHADRRPAAPSTCSSAASASSKRGRDNRPAGVRGDDRRQPDHGHDAHLRTRAPKAARRAAARSSGLVSMYSFFGAPLYRRASRQRARGGVIAAPPSRSRCRTRPRGVRVNAVAPGWIRTPLTARCTRSRAQRRSSRTPDGPWGEPGRRGRDRVPVLARRALRHRRDPARGRRLHSFLIPARGARCGARQRSDPNGTNPRKSHDGCERPPRGAERDDGPGRDPRSSTTRRRSSA